MTDLGIDDKFIKQVGSSIQPGNSAIFLLVREATVDRVLDEVRHLKPHLISTSLPKDKEEELRAALGAEQEQVTA